MIDACTKTGREQLRARIADIMADGQERSAGDVAAVLAGHYHGAFQDAARAQLDRLAAEGLLSVRKVPRGRRGWNPPGYYRLASAVERAS